MTQWLVRRGLLATVPVASLVLAFGACSSEPGTHAPGDAEPFHVVETQELAATPAAAQRLDRVTRQFATLPVEPPRPQYFSPHLPAHLRPPAPTLVPLDPRPVITKGEASRFVTINGRVRPEVPAELKQVAIRPATVDLPLKANGFVRVQPDNSKIGVEFATRGASSQVDIEVADGVASYPNAAPDGGHQLLRVTSEGVEDFIVLDRKPEVSHVDYLVNVSEVAGLRLVSNTLEFLDAGGDPQIRVRPPVVIDADAVVHDATLSVSDCAFDSNVAAPWKRPVTAPGKSECNVRVSWNDAKVIYPAIVDPVWATAGSLATARYRAAAVRMSDGKVLTCGGIGISDIAIKSCELFDPTAAAGAGSWAVVDDLEFARYDFHLVSLAPASIDVLAVGGYQRTDSERYNPTTDTWASTATNFAGGNFSPPMPAVISDGSWVVMIDSQNTPYRYSTAANAWSVGTTNPAPQSGATCRYGAVVVQIPGQPTVLRAGGSCSEYLNSAERYRPSTDSWTVPGNAASMTTPRGDAVGAVLDSNRAIIISGYTGATWTSTAEVYNGTTNTWAATNGNIPNGYYAYLNYRGQTSAVHSSGKLLSFNDYTPLIYDPSAASSAWQQVQAYGLGFQHIGSQANAIPTGGKVLLVPVRPDGGGGGAQTACRFYDLAKKGEACGTTSDCQSGLTCVSDAYDSYWGNANPKTCCDSACTGACNSCKAVNKVSGTQDGSCGPRKTDQQLYNDCPASNSSTCGNYGYVCDGVGNCAKWPSTTQCGGGECVDGNTQNDIRYCDGAGTCKAQTTQDCNAAYKCNYGQCQTGCYNDTDYCAADYFCNTNVTWPGTCDAKKSNGAACNFNNAECTSGHCVDGVCCDVACDGTCMACTNALTGQATGSCKPVTATASTFECSDFGAGTCGQNGKCDGAGACQLYASGTTCADAAACASETSRYIPDTCNGTGSCVDKGTANCATGYSCQNGACNTECTSDANCASNYWCDTTNKVCVADRALGASCARDAVCAGNANCVDGVCCDSGCSGTCRSCLKARTGLASDGICGNILDDTDPENECTTGAAYPNSCAAPGLCNGLGACRPYAKLGVECDTDVCTDSTLTTYECNGAGTCKAKAVQCYPFTCDTTNNVCRVACTLDAHCVEGSSCENGTCVGQLPNGAACNRGPQCQTGFCANIGEGTLEGGDDGAGGEGAGGASGDSGDDLPGVCCDEACQGTCSGCKASIKGFGSDGICEFVKNNTDPANDCEPSPTDKCGLDGQCNGSGACRLAPSGTACGQTSCQGNSVLGQSCNGQGDCINNQGGVDCAPYVCRDVAGAFQCTQPCESDNDCRDGYYCDEASCKKKLANGKACETSGICDSGYCVDGLCCDASCNGQCEACDSPGNEGICSPVQGAPHGARAKCDHAGEECGGACDGVNAASCKYAATGTTCGETSCNNGLANSSACNGQGECRANANVECSPYVCGDDDACLTRCEIDADCSQGYACDETTQRCLPSVTAAECSEDRQSSVGSNGITTPCKPFLCVPASGTCAVSCAASTDCAPEFVCEPSTKTCLPAPPDSGTDEEEGCACRAAGAPSRSSNNYLALMALGVALTGLRRRRQQRRHAAE